MYLLYNGNLLVEEDLKLPVTNRAFQYNDGFFETFILEKGKIRFWTYHQERMLEAASVLQLSVPDDFLPEGFIAKVVELAEQNNCGSLARIKLKIWRSGGGLYTPQVNEVDWLLTAQPAQSASGMEHIKVGFCQTVSTIPSPLSSFKGVNSPVYVMASKEKADRKLDDLILLDPEGNLAELTYSNLFWVEGNTLFTPALETGCLNGVLRRALLFWATQQGWTVQEGKYKPEVLLGADVVFAGNVTGLKVIGQMEYQTIKSDESLLTRIKEGLKL